VVAWRSYCASTPVFGLEKAYVWTSGIDGTATVRASRLCGISREVFHPTSGSTGDVKVSR
jgi:hypothetical protein